MTRSPESSDELVDRLFTAAARPLDARRRHQLLTYLRELQRWNRTLSLTSITDEASIIRKHFLGSLDFLHAFTPLPALPLLDVGTGAGFPGIPLKLWHPELTVDLVESSQRKQAFLQHVCRTLSLADVRCLVTRVEDLAKDQDMQAHYGVIVSRGVGGLRRWLPSALALLQSGGRLVLEKGPAALAEVKALTPMIMAHGGVVTEPIPVPGESSMTRTLVVISKRTVAKKFDNTG
jgi:16S rRNA (guanine527-N7)-methyltransferase